jgi:CheY-like chemotaxis protein
MNRRVLIVDDEPAVCQLIEKTVNTAGMDALVLNNSSQAVQILRSGKFDLVFLDFHMNAPDGVELTREVRQTRANRTTPVILISDDQRPSAVAVG